MANSDIIKIGFDYRASLEQFEKETNGVFEGISDKAGKQKITIQLDAKDDKVIDKIKELQKLKLDKFTFEFGNSGLKEQLQTFDKLENKINEIISLSKGIDLSFNTKNKTEAYNQLKKYADAFKEYYGNEEAMATNAGAKAGYAYYKAYEEALRKGVAQSKLEKVTVDFDVNDSIFSKERIVENRIKEFENFQKYGNADESNLIAEITLLENRILKFNSAYSQVKANLGDAPITPEITKNIEEYVRLLEIAESRAKDAELFGYSSEDINSDKDLANMYLDFAKEDATTENKKYIESLKQEETQAIATAEAEQKLVEAQKETVSNTSNSNNSQIEELKSDIQEVKTELGDVKDRISSIESNGFENVRDDVEKTKESVKELNSELAEMKSNLSSTPQESNISSGNKIINEQKTIQSEVNKTRENIKLLSDEYGQLIYANRGVSHTYGAGLNSNRYHGGTFWTKSTDLAANYGSKIEVANLSMNNPLEVDNKGNNWDEIELYENELTKLQEHIEKIKYKSETIQAELNSLSDNDDGFKLPSFDIDYDGNILSSYGNNIDVVESLEKFRDLFFGFVDLDDPKIQKSITDLYSYLQSYARMTQLLNSEQLNTNQVVEIAKELGHDGVIFKNIIDGSDEVTDIFVTLSQDQVHYVETLDSMTVKEKLAESKAQKLVESRKQLYENIKTFSDLDFDSIIKDFQEGIIPNIWSEFLNTQDFDDDFNNIKANLLKYVSELKSEFELPTKDAFSDFSTNTKHETEGMEQVEKATEEAVQAKKDFATANEGVQSSIDGSENPLKLEAELMEQIAKSARESADAKKEFVEANKQVKDSADESNSDLKAKPKKDRYAKRRKVSEEDFLNYSPNRVNEKLSNSGYTILGEKVNTELVDGLIKVSAKIKDVDGVWKSFSAKVDADGNIFEQRFKSVTNGVDKLETALKNFGREISPALTYQETLDKAQKIKNSLNLGDEYSIKVDSSEFVTITKKLTDVENTGASVTQTFKSAQDAIDNFGKSASNSAEKTSVALKSVKSNIKEVTDESEKLANAQKEQNANANLNKYDKRLDSYNGKVDKYQATIDRFKDGGWSSDTYLKNVQAVKNAVNEYETLLNELKGKDASLVTSEEINRLDNYEKKIKDTIATVTNMSAAEKGYKFEAGQKELDKIHKLLNENSKMSSEAKAKIKAYYKEIESGNPSMSLDKIHGEILKIYNAEVEAGRAGRSFFDTLKNSGFHQIAAQMAGMVGVYDVINVIKQVASTVTELNTQITELAKVSEQSSKQIYADFDSYADIAKEVRGTISDTIAATADWSKNGYSIPDAKQLAEISQLYKNVGDGINIDTANESLISTLKGFQLEADQAEHIVDVFNEVSNNEAISSGGIGEALQRSAASFNAASTSLEKSVSLVTATNSVLQDPEKVGNMWRTVSARLRGSETELKEMGEDTDGLVTSTSKLQALVKGITGFDIMKDKDTYKDIYDIVLGIGEKWQDLSDIDRASLLEALAGKQQSNALAAALSNIDILKKSYEEATNAEGSAREENEEYSKSIQASIDLAQAKLEQLANDTLNSNFLKGAIDAGGKLIEVLDGIVKSGNAIPAATTAIAAALSFKNVGIDTLVAY